MRNVTKEIFLQTLKCQAMAWLMRSGGLDSELSVGERFRMEQGVEIGSRARLLFPGGILVEEKGNAALLRTKILMADPAVTTIFEAYFLVDRFVARADVLLRKKDGWHMLEVKSSANEKKEYVNDMAYTTMLMQDSGDDVKEVSLVIISKDFRLGMDNERLFTIIDYTNDVLDRAEELKVMRETVDELTSVLEQPVGQLTLECKKCPRFRDELSGNVENHIFDLPRLSKKKFSDLFDMKITEIENIPPDFPLTAHQEMVRKSVNSGEIFAKASLGSELDKLTWPVYYLDFETVMTAIPLYPEIAPYTQIPFQYSIHQSPGLRGPTEHFEYLADPQKDCRRELAEKLIRDLGNFGSVLMYTPFEKRIIKELAETYSDQAPQLNLIISRLADLEAIIRKNFYHPDFHGSTSIKKTLPALVPELSYDNLEIGEGGAALSEFAYMAMGKYTKGEVQKKRKNLLEYCKLDTLAMVKLHERLMDFI